MFTTFGLVLFSLFCLVALIQLMYFWLLFARLAFYKEKDKPGHDSPPVSVVIAARNEYHNLNRYLVNVLEQKYPDFEVIVVNHASNDETVDYLKEISPNYPHLKVVNIERELNFFTGKKFPLSLGIKTAKHEYILLTDADCEPADKHWISNMVRNYDEQTEIVLGYGPYKTAKGFLNKIIRYDTFLTAMQYLSYALAGMPYMGVGRNLSYRRSMFFRVKGFTAHYKIASGDDDLFINKVATRKNTRIEISPESFMYSDAQPGFTAWIRQKLRHMTTGKHYKAKFKIMLGTFALTQLLFYLLFMVLLIMQVMPLMVAGIFLLRLCTQFIVHKLVMGRLNEKNLLLFSVLWEVIHIFIVHLVTIAGIFRKKQVWN